MCAVAAIWYFFANTAGGDAPSDVLANPVAQTNHLGTTQEGEGQEDALPELVTLLDAVASVEDEPSEFISDSEIPWYERCNAQTFYYDDDGDGILEPSLECVPEDLKAERHPYTTYSDDVLIDLAYGDAKAAEILGTRLIQRHSGEELTGVGVNYALRAAALSGDVNLISTAASYAYSNYADADGPKVDNIIHSYALQEVAGRLGKESYEDVWGSRFRSLDLSAEHKERIEKRIINTMEGVAEIQTSVTGETDFAEVLNRR